MENNQDKKSEAALREEKVLEFWRENKIFEKSLRQSEGKKEFIFYEGPPTANGKPGIHHLEARAFKDAIPRYKTMRGYHVRRKGGWDTHGLAVEIQTEKKLGLNSKKAIEEYGIAKFNHECKESVWEYLDVWNKFTKRIGFWVDQDSPYVTYENNYIESVWNVVKKVNDQGLFYKDYKVVPWCPRCGTALSTHELAQGYEDVKDLSIYVKFKVKGQENTYILAWTTTPWTLPGNVALAVGKDIDYRFIKKGNETYILAEKRITNVFSELNNNKTDYYLDKTVKGSDLVGLEYEPLFPFLSDTITEAEKPKLEKSYKVYAADFVNTEDGTGIVHTAIMYGQDDFMLGTKIGLPKHHLVNPEGKFIKGTGFLEGRFVREIDTNGKPTLAVDIIEDLKKRNLFFNKENYQHSYPHCWRCHTALIYYARDSWYIRMSDPKIKKKLIAENKKINWEPAHTREGRFGEWLREIKDWAISRERYWGTPLPVWECAKCNKRDLFGSFEDLKNRTKKSGNKYFAMRHGESESNMKDSMHGVVSSREGNMDHLTKNGIEQVKQSAKKLKDKNIDLVFVSPFVRTRETVDILKESLGLDENQIIFDRRLAELDAGNFEGKTWDEYRSMFKDERERFVQPIHGGESLLGVKKRVGEVLYEFEKKYANKKILMISHGGPLWMLFSVLKGHDVNHSISMTGGSFRHSEDLENRVDSEFKHFANAEIREFDFIPLPHNENYELDLHRPFLDEVRLACECGNEQVRTREVMDVWLDSGCMPFAQDHYPFENKKWVDGAGYPADYISEAIDQTRGWFYTLHAIGVLMGKGLAYKNVICLGHLLDASGKKMSKSLGNVIDPWVMMEKYGVDTLRLWMYSVNQPGESKNFDEKTVMLIHNQVFGLLYNVLAFYELYRDKNLENNDRPKSENVLDVWILARLDKLTEMMTKNLDNYKLLEPVRAIRDFVGDLSTWYLRRSRERIKNGDKEAKQTLYFVLKTLAIVMAPFAPFSAEDIWSQLRNENDKESVHLENWPTKAFKILSLVPFLGPKVLEKMETVRSIVTLGLEARQKTGIKVRQPLNRLEIIAEKLSNEYIEIIKDELNIKNIDYIIKVKIGLNKVNLDTNITPELKQEGDYRELVRGLQDMRKKLGLTPSDTISLIIETNDEGRELVQKFEFDMKRIVLASTIEFKENDGEEIKIDQLIFKIKIEKI